jgi:hypothetical protein
MKPATQRTNAAPQRTVKNAAPRRTVNKPPAKRGVRKQPAASAGRTITLTVPSLGEAATRVLDAMAFPVAAARRVLPTAPGLPLLYAGLGALAVVGALEAPVALGIGIGYAVLRHRDRSPGGRNAGRSATSE